MNIENVELSLGVVFTIAVIRQTLEFCFCGIHIPAAKYTTYINGECQGDNVFNGRRTSLGKSKTAELKSDRGQVRRIVKHSYYDRLPQVICGLVKFMDDESALIRQLAFGMRLTRYATVGAYTLVVYDFFITFDRELETIHKSRWSLSKFLYYACRFGPLLLYPIVIYGFIGDHDMESCKPFVPLVTALFNLFLCFPQCIFILRVWAFTGAKRRALLIYLPCLFAYIGIVCWASWDNLLIFSAAFLLGKAGCFRDFPRGSNTFSWTIYAGIALDGIVGLILVVHCYMSLSFKTRIGKLISEQGLLYYPLMFCMNTITAVVSTIGTFRGYDALVFFVVVNLSNILACRFMIQIREYATADPDSMQLSSLVRRDLEASQSLKGPIIVQSSSKPLESERKHSL